MLYDRPVYQLMEDASAALTPPCTVSDIVKWFEMNYPRVRPGTVQAHVHGMTSNNPNRHNYRSLALKPPLFFRSEQGLLERFDSDVHLNVEHGDGGDSDEMLLEEEVSNESATLQAAEFALENQLETFLGSNWDLIKWGRPLQVWQGPDGRTGHQFVTPVGRLDFLCVDTAANTLVVVELKRGRPSDRVVGQIARYIGWVRVHLATQGQAVEGLIIAHESDDYLRYAVAAMPGVRLQTYEVKFELRPVDMPETAASA